MIENEEILKEIQIPLELFKPFPKLPVPQTKKGYRVENETWVLAAEPPYVPLDLTPEVTLMAGVAERSTVHTENRVLVDLNEESTAGLLDRDKLYSNLLEYKALRGYGNILISKSELLPILQGCTLYVAEEDSRDLEFLQQVVQRLLRTYLDRFLARKEREVESRNLEPGVLVAKERIAPYYTVRLPDELLKEVEKLLKKKKDLFKSGGKPLPRLYIDRHLL